ncbi:MAG: PAS domain S-box protein [Chloroflexales bacterium]|nr:PAS domain S-box protein [Chloroflexales bacterium]
MLLLTGTLVSGLSEGLHRARRRAAASQQLQAVTLASIGDAVITTDLAGRITFLNAEAKRLTGWAGRDATGQPLSAVFRIINEQTRAPVEDPTAKVLHTGATVGLANHTVLIARDGSERPIDDSGAPIRHTDGSVRGVVLVFRDVSAQKQAEEALRQSEERYRQIVETTQEGVWLIDAAGKTRFVNARMGEMLGYSVDEMLGMPLFAFMDADVQALATKNLERRRKGIAEQVDFRLRRKDGAELWALISTKPLMDRAGGYTGALAMLTDITERKRAEEALQRSERALKLFVEHAPAAIAMFNRTMTYIAASQRFLADYRLTDQHIIGRSHYEIFPEIPQRWKDIHQRCLAGAVETAEEDPFPREDGTLDWVRWEIHPWYERPAEIGGLILFSEVVTARKQAEIAINRSAERLRVLADASHAFAEVGAEYQVLLDQVGRTITNVLGEGCSIRLLSDDEVWLELVGLYDVEHEATELMRTVLGAAPLRVDEPSLATRIFHSVQPLLIPIVDLEQIRAATKPEYWSLVDRLCIHSMIVVPMRVQGRAIGVLIMYRHRREQPSFDEHDLSLAQDLADRAALAISNARLLAKVQLDLAERARVEDEIRRLNDELEQRVAERTVELTAANKELEAFSYSVSHDLRAPLRGIDGFSRILIEDYSAELPDEARRYLDLVREGAQQMGQLIDDLLAFSRLSRQPLARRPVALAQLVRQCIEELRGEQAGRQITLSVGDLPGCQADPTLLKQVWINLIANALKYTRRRERAVIEIGCREQDGEPVYWIKDNGVGFDMRYSSKLFGVFQRMHRAEDYEGTGVGLAIVQRIIHRHGGRIWAEAEVDRGALFSFTLGGARRE